MKDWPAEYPVISVRNEAQEAPTGITHLYRGIHVMRLNHFVEVTFTPRPVEPLTGIVLPADLDDIRTEDEARLVSLLFATYAVTTGVDERQMASACAANGWTGQEPVLFNVDPASFEHFSSELSSLEERLAGIFDALPISEVLHLEVVRFLASDIVGSPRFRASDRDRLGVAFYSALEV